MEDVVLAIQARVGWEFGGRVPKEYTLTLAAQTNAVPLPSVPEVFGVRLPASSHVLTSVDFDLVPNKPPPTVKQYDEEIEEVEDESEEEEEVEPGGRDVSMQDMTPFPQSTSFRSQSDVDMASPTAPIGPVIVGAADEGSDMGGDDDEGLFGAGDDDSDNDEGMESVEVPDMANVNGIKRKLVEDDEYD